MCNPMVHRQAYYKYIIIVVVLAFSLEFPRFFEMELIDANDTTINYYYVTTSLNENAYYVQFNNYWNELIATGFLPLIALCYMNLQIFLKVKVGNSFYTLMSGTRRQIGWFFKCCFS